MSRRPRLSIALASVVLVAIAAACGGGESDTGGLSSPADLGGRTVGVASLTSVSALELRYVLQESYGLDLADVTIMESPAESLADLLRQGVIDAAIFPAQGVFALQDDDTIRVLSHVTQEMRERTGAAVIASLLVTYPDVAEQKNAALSELNRMLAESVTYARANRDALIDTIAAEQAIDPALVRWLWDRQQLRFGDLSQEARGEFDAVWQAGLAVGDIDELPAIETLLFEATDAGPTPTAGGDRTTISLALLNDPLRRIALAAIERGIVTSNVVDLVVTYLPLSALTEAAPSKQYDALEATPLTVPLGAIRGPAFLVLSAALQDVDVTLLFVRRDSEG